MGNVDSDIEKLLLTIAEDRRREYGERIWRTVEYFTVILTAILSVSIGLFIELSKINNVKEGYALLILLFAVGIFISVTAWFNVRREYKHQLEAIAEKMKAEWSLGLAKKVVPKEQRMFQKDEHILLERYYANTFGKDEEWVKDKMKLWQNRQAALIWFGIVFWGFAFFFTITITLIIYWAYPTIAFLQIPASWIPLIIFAIGSVLCEVEHREYTRITKASS